MSPQVDLRILELLCSRLCHDLVGPIGAVNNGTELLEEFDPAMMQDVLPLISTSAKQAWRRLDFFRVAFGFGGGRSMWKAADLRRYAEGILEGGKVSLAWPAASSGELDGTTAKLLLNMVLLGSEALHRGGELGVAIVATPSYSRVAVTAKGPTMAVNERVQATLGGSVPVEEIDARTVQAYFTYQLASMLGGEIRIERMPDNIALSFSTAG